MGISPPPAKQQITKHEEVPPITIIEQKKVINP